MNKQDSANELQRGGLTIQQDGRYVQLAVVMDSGTILSEFAEQPDITDDIIEPASTRRIARRHKTVASRLAAATVELSAAQEPQFNRFWSEKALLPVAKKRILG